METLKGTLGLFSIFYFYQADIKLTLNHYFTFEESTVPIIQSGRFVKPDAYNITFVQLNNHDNLVVQCNASNVHGYVFVDVYLNVLGKSLFLFSV